MMNRVLGMSLDWGKSEGRGGRGEWAERREKERGGGGGGDWCGDCRERVV